MTPLELLSRNDPKLKQPSAWVEDILNPDFQRFLDQLIECGEENLGVGIAAPQVGKNYRAFILAPKPSTRYPDSPTFDPMPIINPEILETYGPIEKGWEGCLSVPGFRGLVPRHHGVRVRYWDRTGTQHETNYEGFVARIFQHEYDHVQGILYPEKMDPENRLLDLNEFFTETGIRVSK